MSKVGIRRLAEALDELIKEIPTKERGIESRRADLAKAEESLASYLRTIEALKADIAAIQYTERLHKLYGKEPRT